MRLDLLGHGPFSRFWITQFADVLILTLLLWWLLRSIRSKSAQLGVIGAGLFALVLLVLGALRFHATGQIMEEIARILPLALVVLFHQEIKAFLRQKAKYLESIPFLGAGKPGQKQDAFIEDLVETCRELSGAKIGALFVIEREEDVSRFCADAIPLDNIPFQPKLVRAMLTPPGPLHDGAIVINRNRRIILAHAFLPMQQGIQGFGGRHRAGLGISIQTDAVAVVVSEETQAMRICFKGELSHSLTEDALRRRVYHYLYADQVGKPI